MSSITVNDCTTVLFKNGLVVLKNILTEGSSHADAASFPSTSLIADMKPLTFQVQVVSNITKKTVQRLTGTEVGEWPDNETTMEQLIARIDKTIALLDTVKPEALNNKDTIDVKLELGPLNMTLSGKDYILGFAIPNFFFHLQTAYAILRMKGVDLGKKHYISPFLGLKE